jgi:CDP-diacylglycerol--serine O-phosphatidyltransferase
MRHIPNSITCLNLFCGCLSVVSAFNGRLDSAAYFIFAAAVFDFFDGFAARMLKVRSNIGKELDSLADMVSFGVAPASMMYMMLLRAVAAQGFPNDTFAVGGMISLSAFLIAVFSGLRLAKFNTDTRQTDSFIGLPTPANALFICALVFAAQGSGGLASLSGNMYFLLVVTVAFSLLLVAELPLFSLKFKTFDFKSNKIRYIFIGLSAVILVVLHWSGLAAIILLYILLSIFVRILCNRKPSSTQIPV